MTFLSKYGGLIVKGIGIALGVLPMVSTFYPQTGGTVQVISKDLAEIMQIILNVEAMGQALGLAGADKLRAAAPLIADIFKRSSVLAGKPIADEVAYFKACTVIAGGCADLLNAVSPDAAKPAA